MLGASTIIGQVFLRSEVIPLRNACWNYLWTHVWLQENTFFLQKDTVNYFQLLQIWGVFPRFTEKSWPNALPQLRCTPSFGEV